MACSTAMNVRSLGCRTDLMLIGWDGVIDEVDGVIRARTPGNPSYYFGNFLLFPDAPVPGGARAWLERYEAAFADDPRIRHVCLRWDRPDGARGAVDELVAAGFEVDDCVVLRLGLLRPPPRVNRDVVLRRIESDADWAAVTELQVAVTVEQHGPAAEPFARAQMARQRGFVAAGHGAWLGAFEGGDLVGDLGVFVEDGLGRFQAVETAAASRRRGVCGTLVHHAARVALDELGAETLVIVGLPDHTSALYASLGFEPCERLIAVVRPDPDHRAPAPA
jgi:hypothetical protein